jgi:hypothetical protein
MNIPLGCGDGSDRSAGDFEQASGREWGRKDGPAGEKRTGRFGVQRSLQKRGCLAIIGHNHLNN